MTSTHGLARVCGLVLLAAAVAAPAPTKDFRGAITGRVTDTSNAVLPGATVPRHQYRNQSTDVERHEQRWVIQPAVPDARRF